MSDEEKGEQRRKGGGEKGNKWTGKYYIVVGEQEWEKVQQLRTAWFE